MRRPPTVAEATDSATAPKSEGHPAVAGADLLEVAADRVIAAWGSNAAEVVDAAELREALEVLLNGILDPAFSDPVAAETGSDLLRRRLLELLRAELVELWAAAEPPPAPTEMLQILESMERLRRELEPDWDQYFASRLVGPEGLELVVEVAHDLRSPLTSILFLAETLRRGQSGDVNEVQRRQLGIVYSAALGLISVASDMIELARGGTQLMEKEPSTFSVSGVLESVRDIVQPMAEEKGLSLRLLPADGDKRLGYPVALSRVLLNLTSNALKFTEEGLIEITAQASPDDRVEFAVRDTGRGLDDDAIRSLFSPFRRTRGGRRHAFSGSGLGLMISRRLVEAMGSELQIETRAGWGTRFFFEVELPPVFEAE